MYLDGLDCQKLDFARPNRQKEGRPVYREERTKLTRGLEERQ